MAQRKTPGVRNRCAVATPGVGCYARYLRSRITRALYAKMGLTGNTLEIPRNQTAPLVVESPSDYVDAAVRIACDRRRRDQVRELIASNAAILFEDEAEVQDLGQWLSCVVED